jgi:phage tail-like protein
MADPSKSSKREDASPVFIFSVRDVSNKEIGQFSKLTGGEMTVSMISFNQVFEYGGSVTRYFPGHTTFAPVKLARALDSSCKPIYDNLWDSVTGSITVVRTNFSIAMIDHQGNEKIIWNLYNAVPTAISGFNFNQETGTQYADFEVTIQAEHIEMKLV